MLFLGCASVVMGPFKTALPIYVIHVCTRVLPV